jgi:hypothetical protein
MEHRANRPGAAAPSTADCGLVDERDSNLTASTKVDRAVNPTSITGGKFAHQVVEIHRTTSPAGFTQWVVCLNDLYLGLRPLEKFYVRREAIASAQWHARQLRTPFTTGRPWKPKRLATRVKHALFQKRQERVARRAAKRRLS